MSTWVNGYYRKNGTYVPGHYRRDRSSSSIFGSSSSGRRSTTGSGTNKGRFTPANLKKYYNAWYG